MSLRRVATDGGEERYTLFYTSNLLQQSFYQNTVFVSEKWVKSMESRKDLSLRSKAYERILFLSSLLYG